FHLCVIAYHRYLDNFATLCHSAYIVLFNNLWTLNVCAKEKQLAELHFVALHRPVDMALFHLCVMAYYRYLDNFATLCHSAYMVLFNNLWTLNVCDKEKQLAGLHFVALLRSVDMALFHLCVIADHSYLDTFAT